MDTLAIGLLRVWRYTDVELFARICKDWDIIDIIGIQVMPQDVPDPKATLLYGVRAGIQNSIKPIYFSTDSVKVNQTCIELLQAAFEGDFANHVWNYTTFTYKPPLYWEEGVLRAFMDTVPPMYP